MNDTPNNTYIEQMATTKLKECLLRTNKVVPKINDMDKEPLWDGHLYLYNSENDIKNENVKGRIPIQVKGTCQGGLKRSKISYSVSIDDLKKYKIDGGVIYFVIVMGKKLSKFSIYYNSLLPFDIARILQSKGTQKETTIYLNKFPHHDIAKIIAILNDFIQHREKQMGTAEQGLKILEMLHNGKSLEELNIRCFKFDVTGDIFGDIRNTLPSYIYAEDENGILIPIESTIFDAISTEIRQQVIVGKDIYDCTIELKNAVEGESFSIAHSITLFQAREQDSLMTLKVDLSDDLDERITALDIILSLYKYQTISIPDVLEANGACFDDVDIQNVSKQLSYHKKIKQALNILGVRKKLSMNSLTAQDWTILNSIVHSVIEKKPIDSRLQFNHTIGTVTINNCRIIMRITKDKSGKQRIKPLEQKDLEAYITYDDGTNEKHRITVCSIFKREDFANIDNLLFEHIYRPVERAGYNPKTAESINMMVLEIIAAYDISLIK